MVSRLYDKHALDIYQPIQILGLSPDLMRFTDQETITL